MCGEQMAAGGATKPRQSPTPAESRKLRSKCRTTPRLLRRFIGGNGHARNARLGAPRAPPTAAVVSGETWQLSSALTYVTANLSLDISQWGIADTLQHVPFAGAWNGSLWTLQFEFLAYLVAGLLLTSRLVRRHLKLVLCLVTVLTAAAIALTAGPLDVDSYYGFNSLRLGASFAAGMMLWAFRDSLPRTATLTTLAGAASLVLYFSSPAVMYALAPLPLGYFLLSLGASRRIRLGSTNDISYGAYIYAFPVMQLLVVMGGDRLGYVGLIVATLVLTAPLAWLSWRLVERPSLQLKHLRLGLRHSSAAPSATRDRVEVSGAHAS
jgi:peptidoglycan/LPS O-acetylase OafA/YrhL